MKTIKISAIVVIGYMLFALAWWSFLLYKKNNEIYQLKSQLITHESVVLSQSDINQNHENQKLMIIGEGVVFGMMLIAGIWVIWSVFNKEIIIANRHKNFLLSVTHELKSPIAAIHLILETLKKRKLNPTQSKSLMIDAIDETKRLENLVDNILLANQIDKKYNYHFESKLLQNIISKIVDPLNKRFQNRILIKNNIALTIEIDIQTFNIVLTNLLRNALKYSSGIVEVESIYIKNKNLKILIKDQGIGVPNSEKKEIFKKFYRVGNEEIRTKKGTGLGLFLAKEIVIAHGGNIQITDNKPKGSIFTISLPNASRTI